MKQYRPQSVEPMQRFTGGIKSADGSALVSYLSGDWGLHRDCCSALLIGHGTLLFVFLLRYPA